MNEDLWFVYEDGYAVAAFKERDVARKKLNALMAEDPDADYEIASIGTDELLEFPDEYEIARESGLT